jgi:hypothetical protein
MVVDRVVPPQRQLGGISRGAAIGCCGGDAMDGCIGTRERPQAEYDHQRGKRAWSNSIGDSREPYNGQHSQCNQEQCSV